MEVAVAMRDTVQSAVGFSQDNWYQVYLPSHHSKHDFSNFYRNCHLAVCEYQLA